MSVNKGDIVRTASKSVVANRDILALARDKGFDLVAGFEPQKDHIYTVTRAISARVNQNYDGFPSEELKKSYITFLGKPVFVNHLNDDPSKARGRVVGARYVENGDDKYIEVIQEVNAKKFPLLAKELVESGLDSVSMGCSAERTICSFCDNVATGMFDMCTHVLNSKGKKLRRQGANGQMEDILVYEECRDLGFFELSYVFDPADETAVVSNLVMASKKTAFLGSSNRVYCDLPGCNNWAIYNSERYHEQWIGGGGEMRPHDYCCQDHCDQYEKLFPSWKVESVVNNPVKFHALQRQAYGEIEAPENIDTLRDDSAEQEEEFHQYVESPPGLAEPDLDKARELDRRDEMGKGYEDMSDYLQDEVDDGNGLNEEMLDDPENVADLGDQIGVEGPDGEVEVDPITGEPVDPEAEVDPITGEPVEPEVDPITGEPIEEDPDLVDPGDPGAKVDPITGEPIEDEHSPDEVMPFDAQDEDNPFKTDEESVVPVEKADDPKDADALAVEDPTDEDVLVDPEDPAFMEEQQPVPPKPAPQAPAPAPEQKKVPDAAPAGQEPPAKKKPPVAQPTTNEVAPKPPAPKPDEVSPPAPEKEHKPNDQPAHDKSLDKDKSRPDEDEDVLKDPGDPESSDSAETPEKVDDSDELAGLAEQLGISEDELLMLDPEDLIQLLDADGSEASDNKEKKMPSANTKTAAARKDTTMSRDSLAQRGRVASRGRVADQSRNDQGEMEDTFITQTPPPEEVETADGEGDAPNSEEQLVASIRAGQAKLRALREAKQRKQADGFLGEGQPEGETAETIDPPLSGTDDQSLKGDFESADPNEGVEETQPKDASRRAEVVARRRRADFASWVRKTAGKSFRDANSVGELRTWVSQYSREAGIKPEVMYPIVRPSVIALRKRAGEVPEQFKKNDNDEGTSGDKKADDIPDFIQDKIDGKDSDKESARKDSQRRKVADEKLDVAAPDGRVDVERPTSDTTDDEAQESMDKRRDDFGNNAGDDIADPDLSTSQNWAPGAGKSSAWKQASGVNAVRLARAYITAGIEAEDQEWVLASQFEKMSAAVVNDRLALLERVNEARPRRTQTARKTAGSFGAPRSAPLPQNLSRQAAPQQRVAAADGADNDIDLFL